MRDPKGFETYILGELGAVEFKLKGSCGVSVRSCIALSALGAAMEAMAGVRRLPSRAGSGSKERCSYSELTGLDVSAGDEVGGVERGVLIELFMTSFARLDC